MATSAPAYDMLGYAATGSTTSYNITAGTTQYTATANTFHVSGFSLDSSNVKFFNNRTQTNSYSGTWTAAPYMYLGYFYGSGSDTADIKDMEIDWVIGRKSATTAPSTSVGTEEKSPGPIAYWSFDEGFGTTTYSYPQTNQNGTISGAIWQSTDMCIKDSCLYFDGTNDYVSIADDPVLDFTNTLTLQAWIKPSSLASDSSRDRIISKSGAYELAVTTNSSQGLTFRTNDGSTHDLPSGIIPNLNEWSHVAVTYDGANVKFYLDGKLRYTSSAYTYSAANSAVALTIGNINNGGSFDRPFHGFIDEPKIFNYARTAIEIASDYNSFGSSKGVTGQVSSNSAASGFNLSDGLVGHWKMDQASWNGTSSEVIDSSGTGDHGVAECDVAYNTCASGVPSTTLGKYGRGGSFNQDGQRVYINNRDFTTTERLESEAIWFKIDALPSGANKSHVISHISTYDATGQNPGASTHGRSSAWINSTGNVVFNALSYTGSLSCSDWTIGQYLNQTLTGTSVVTAGTWNQLAYTIDWGSSNTIQVNVYLNGNLEAQYTEANKSCYSQSYYTWLGKAKGTAAGFIDFDGTLDDYRRYKRILSPLEIKALYQWGPEPLANLPLDENTGTTANDISENAFTGTLTNGPTWDQGKFGNAVRFDGSDDYIDLGSSSTFAFSSGITLAGWVKPDTAALSGTPRILSKREANNGYVLSLGSGAARFLVGDGASFDTATGSTTLVAGQWYHIVGTWDGENTVKIYVNGRLEGTTTGATSLVNSSENLKIGGETGGNYFDGAIDQIQIFNYAVGADQVSNLMNGGSVNDPAVGSPVGHPILQLSYEEGYGTTAYDTSPQGLNGTLTNMAFTATSGRTNSGKVGKGVAFDGTDDAVSVPDNTIFSVNATNQLTVSTWVNFTSLSARQCVVCKGGNTQYEWEIRNESNGTFSVLLYTSAGSTYMGGTLTKVLSTDTWYKIAFSVDLNVPKMDVYVDGVKLQTYTATSGSYTNGTAALQVGRRGDNVHALSGFVDETKVYNYALSASEIALDYNQGKSVVFGNISTTSAGNVVSNSNDRSYCVPGDTTACNAPVAEWKFDEGTSTVANDTSGNANTGTLTSGPTWGPGKLGNSVKLDGVDDHVLVSNSTSLQPTNITISAWFYLDSSISAETYGVIVDKPNTTHVSPFYDYHLRIDAAATTPVLTAAFVIGAYTAADTVVGTTTVTKNVWHHAVATYDGTTMITYLDGKLEGSASNAGSITHHTESLYIGAFKNLTTGNFPGRLDQVRIYDYAKTPAQVAWEYNQGLPVAMYKFDECEGSTVYDWAPNSNGGFHANNGTLVIGGTGGHTAQGTCNTSGTVWGDGASGKTNASIDLDGTDDYVTIPDNARLSPGNGDYSMSAWIKTSTNFSTIGWIFSNYGSSTNNATGIMVNSTENPVCFFRDASANTVNYASTVNISDGNWHHITCVLNGNNSYQYVDGNLVASADATSLGTITTTGRAKALGIIASTLAGERYDGQIDDLRVFNYAVTPEQIKTILNDGAVSFR